MSDLRILGTVPGTSRKHRAAAHRRELSRQTPKALAATLAEVSFRLELVLNAPDGDTNPQLRLNVIDMIAAQLADLSAALGIAIERDTETRAVMAREQSEALVDLRERLERARTLWRARRGAA